MTFRRLSRTVAWKCETRKFHQNRTTEQLRLTSVESVHSCDPENPLDEMWPTRDYVTDKGLFDNASYGSKSMCYCCLREIAKSSLSPRNASWYLATILKRSHYRNLGDRTRFGTDRGRGNSTTGSRTALTLERAFKMYSRFLSAF